MHKECQQCDFDNPTKKGRGYWCCPNCGRDYSVEYVMLWEARLEDEKLKKNTK